MVLNPEYCKEQYLLQKEQDKVRQDGVYLKYKKSIDILNCLYDFSYEVGHCCDTCLPKNNTDCYKFTILRIHEHAIKVFKECLILIENASASGSMARWRTLFEFMIVTLVLERNPDNAERYMDFTAIGDYKVVKKLEKYKDKLGLLNFNDTEFTEIKRNYEEIKQKYHLGDDVNNDYLWAQCKDIKGKINLYRLCEYLELEHLYAYVDESHQYNHPSPKAILCDRGCKDEKGDRYLFSPFGLSLPIQLIAIALFNINKVLLTEYLKVAEEKKEQLLTYLELNLEFIQQIIPGDITIIEVKE